MVVNLRIDNGGRMFLEVATCAMGGECGKEVMARSVQGVLSRQADVAMGGRLWWYCMD
jgi:hypothetical protein